MENTSTTSTAAIEAAKLLRELEKEAEKRVFATIQPKLNIIHFSGLALHSSITPFDTTGKEYAKFEIKMHYNGEEIVLHDVFEVNHLDTANIPAMFWNAVKGKIEKELVALFEPELKRLNYLKS